MNEGVGQVIIEVEDQDRALEFWSNTVGFELAHDAPYGESRRWIEVTTRDKAVVLVLSRRRGDRPKAPEELPTSNIFVYCYDLSRTHEELRERGAEFPVPPRQMHFGWWSLFEDQHGTRYALGRWDCKDYGRLDRLIGTWKTEGWTTEAPADRIDAVDTYERLPGGALLHLVNARVADQRVEGAEIVGYDTARGGYVTRYFGSDGASAYDANLTEDDAALVWTMQSKCERFTGTFNDERTVITGHWDALDDSSNWQPWMDLTLTKQAS